MTVSAVILAAGRGDRMGSGENKVLLPLCGEALICHTVRAFSTHPDIDEVVLAVHAQEREKLDQIVHPLFASLRLVVGGATRRDSALAGVRAASGDHVLIHDGARPFPSTKLIARVVRRAQQDGAAIPVMPVVDLLRRLDPTGSVRPNSDVKGNLLARMQTPQGFHRELILRCLETAPPGIRDDATALLLAGKPVSTLSGESINIKVTHPTDLKLAEAIAAQLK